MALCVSLLIRLVACVVTHPKWAATIVATIIAAITCASVFLPRTYATEAGEWMSVALSEDGSVARLGPHTKIVVKYDREQRWIQQLKGEATYQVAKDPNRPFFVECNGATVRAIGTKFGVTCDVQSSHVTVAEGTVSVFRGLIRRDQAASADHVRADAGQRVLLDQWTPLAPRPIDVDVALAWEQSRIFFDGTPIEQAIGEFNRRHRQPIPIPTDPGKDYRLIFGWCSLDDREKFAACLEMEPGQQRK